MGPRRNCATTWTASSSSNDKVFCAVAVRGELRLAATCSASRRGQSQPGRPNRNGGHLVGRAPGKAVIPYTPRSLGEIK
jgi:hypothetical protein